MRKLRGNEKFTTKLLIKDTVKMTNLKSCLALLLSITQFETIF